MTRSKLVLLAVTALALACGGDLPAAFLHIQARPAVGPLDTLDLRFLQASGGEAFYHESVELAGDDLAATPYTVRVEARGSSPFAGPVKVAIVGFAGAAPVATWTGTVDLAAKAEQTVWLEALPTGCDADADGFKDCAVAGCCTDAEAPFSDCNDESALEAPLAEAAACRACTDTDADGTSDCLELAHEPPCDPNEAASGPEAPEVCDSRDNDCDGQTDEGLVARDWDGRVLGLGAACGTGACADGTVACSGGRAACSTASLASPEVGGDGLDNDCNGATDEGGVADDTDGDGVTDVAERAACVVPLADLLAEVHPGAAEPCCPADTAARDDALARCDLDCDGELTACAPDDADADGYAGALDCDDGDAAAWPGAPERCGDGVDQDCDGTDASCTTGLDQDGDQYEKGTDCDDGDDAVHPGAQERCNGLDDDCDGVVDEGNPEANGADGSPQACGTDEGECQAGTYACRHAPGDPPHVVCLGEVPQGDEACNAKDDDCDGDTDEELDPTEAGCLATGVCATQVVARCAAGAWTCPYASVIGVSYEEQEVTCDDLDNDCDGLTDEGLEGPALSTCKKLGECLAHGAEIVAACNDGAWECAYPFASYQADETRCDGLDNDCDGLSDEGIALVDGDGGAIPLGEPCGTGACGGGEVVCEAETGAAVCSTAGLAGEEACNELDDDCDGATDEDQAWAGLALGATCDGLGACGQGVVECLTTGGGATCSTNPDGSTPGTADEACNQQDDDCDGLTDEALDATSADSPCRRVGVCTLQNVQATCDGGQWRCSYAGVAGYEAGSETWCDGKDNDCDGQTDEDPRYVDETGTSLPLGAPCDGLGACGFGTVECGTDHRVTCSTDPSGHSSAAVPESCNGVDDDCDGATDNGLDATAADAPCRFAGVCTRLNVVASCDGGAWTCDYGAIVAYDAGVEARCDGLDNDCDGQTDEDFSWIDPVSAQARRKGDPCGSGACDGGVVICTASQAALACSTDLASDLEVCDGEDNDCDGQIDEGLLYTDPADGQARSKGQSCDGLGECGAGVVECGANLVITCASNPDGSQAGDAIDACDGLDNDCDGLTDEELAWQGHALGTACDGTGACGTGVVECARQAPVTTCSTNPDGSQPGDLLEACNGLDDDCDAQTDEGLGIDDSPCRTTGVCTHALVGASCVGAGGWLCDYSAVPGWRAVDEQGRCDGLDNDCDGQTDEDFAALGQACDGDDADLCANGTWVCAANGAGVTCADPTSAVEACTDPASGLAARDEDCDGLTDEAGAEGCRAYFLDLDGDGFGRTGDLRCLCAPDGVAHYTAAVDGDCDDSAAGAGIRPDAAEICDGLDDDCDGQTDAADPDLAADDRPACEVQAGACQGAAKAPELCVGGAWQSCDAADYAATSDAFQAGYERGCDGVDNDCDGAADEDFSLSLPDGSTAWGVGSACGTGACAGGTTACNGAGDGLACATLAAAKAEVCGGGDDDCDGKTDAADPDLAANDHPACELQTGACQGATKPPALCNGGAWQGCGPSAYAAHATTYQAGSEASCDGVDNDCDGGTDEDFELTLPDATLVSGVGKPCGTGACAGGTTVCVAAKTAITCSSLGNLAAESCNGADDDCDGLTDASDPDLATHDAPPCEKTAGACAGATKPPALCVGGAWLACSTTVYAAHDGRYQAGLETSCDGVDNDCDGLTDDDFALSLPDGSSVAGAGKPCGTGRCAGGLTACNAGGTGIECPSIALARAESCNGSDDDCDGLTDAADADLERPLCSYQLGVCLGSRAEPERCVGGAWGPCSLSDYAAHSAAYKAGPETTTAACDGLDNNCSGATDENYVPSATACGVGACARTGVLACVGGAQVDTCAPGAPAASDATCDNVDDDCNGTTDEDFPAGPSTCGVGACARSGVRSCTNGSSNDTCTPGAPAEETCNGSDDDCDGLTDAADTDDVVDGRLRYDHPACAEQDGVCAGSAAPARLCSGGTWHACDAAVFQANAATYQAGFEVTCDGLDNDCDGTLDEDFSALMPDGSSVAGVGAACGFGACVGGTTLCNAAHDGTECSSLVNLGTEVCGGGDEDCDGLTDEFLGAWSSGDLTTDKPGGTPGLAAAANGTLYATWQYDPTNARDLYFGENPGSGWTVTPLVTDHAAGGFSAVFVASDGSVHVVYNDDDPNTKALRVISRVGGTWGAPVDIEGGGAGKITVGWVSAEIDATNALHVAYYVSDADKRDLHYATNASGAWIHENVEAGNVSDLGSFASLRLAGSGEPRVAYADASAKLVRYAARVGGSWTFESVTGTNSSTSYSISLALDEADVPHVAFWDQYNTQVTLAKRGTSSWLTQTVETIVVVGQYGSALAIDPDGRLHVVYHAIQPNADLRYATAPAFGGTWTASAIDTAGTTGRYPHLVLTPQGNVRIVHVNATPTLRLTTLACP